MGFSWPTDEAIANLQKALELKPDYAEAHNMLGEVLVSVGKVQEAIPHFERALQLLPNNAEIKKNLSMPVSEQSVNERGRAVPLSKTSNPRSNSTTTIGISHHFLLCRMKLMNSAARPGVPVQPADATRRPGCSAWCWWICQTCYMKVLF